MSRHHGLRPLLDQGAVDHPIGGVPLLAGEVIDRGDQVLVPLIAPISREVLDGDRHPMLRDAVQIGRAHAPHHLRVAAVGAGVGDGVAPVAVDVAHRREGQVEADAGRLRPADVSQQSGVLHAPGGGHLELAAEGGALYQGAAPPRLQVGRDQQGDLGRSLDLVVPAFQLLRLVGPVHDAADVQVLHHGQGVLVRIRQTDGEKHLPDLLLQRHPSQCLLDPTHIVLIQMIGPLIQVQLSHRSSLMLRQALCTHLLGAGVHDDRDDQHRALNHVLVVAAQTDHHQPLRQHADDQHASHHTGSSCRYRR